MKDTLVLKFPNFMYDHREWISDLIMNRISYNFCIEYGILDNWEISLKNDETKRTLVLKDDFFSKASKNWLSIDSLPKLPLKKFSSDLLNIKNLPIIYGSANHFISDKNNYYLDIDIFGSSYFMLSRYEEIVINEKDGHFRFPAYKSLAKKSGFLNRPIIDEYINILKKTILFIWPNLKLKNSKFKMILSHDVDEPVRYGFRNNVRMFKAITSDFINRRDFRSPFLAVTGKFLTKDKLNELDPFNTFDWIMNKSESFGLKSSFYFMTNRSNKKYDCDYSIKHPAIINLLKTISSRGHEIGLHPSYDSYNEKGLIKVEKEKLIKVLSDVGIKQKVIGGRMHFLRFEIPSTFFEWESAGFKYESSLGYADEAGFRCGSCFEYRAFDSISGKKLNLILRPLIAMECSVIDKRYMNFGEGEKAYNVFTSLKQSCMNVDGNFTLLWHNSRLVSDISKELYLDILNY